MNDQRFKGRILFFTETAHSWGGVATWCHELTRGLADRGWEVYVGLARGRWFHKPEAYRKAHPHMKTVDLECRQLNSAARQGAVRKAIAALQPRIVVPVNLFDALAATVGAKADGADVRLVTVHHGFVPLAIENQRQCAAWIDLGVSVNRLVARLLENYMDVPLDRIRHLPSGCPASTANVARTAGRNSLRIAYVGRLEQQEKRVLDAVRLIHELDALNVPYRFHFVGSGPCEDELKQALSAPANQGRVVFRGYVDREELLSAVYPQLDCVMLFSPAEGSPTVLWEAMSQGVVPVTSRYLGCLAEGMVRHERTGLLFEVGDMRTAARALQGLAGDRSRLDALSDAARAAVTRQYTVPGMVEGWSEAFQAVLQLPPARGTAVPEILRPRLPRLERWGVPGSVAGALRALLGRTPAPACAGDEWPLGVPCQAGTLEQIRKLAEQLDHAPPQSDSALAAGNFARQT